MLLTIDDRDQRVAIRVNFPQKFKGILLVLFYCICARETDSRVILRQVTFQVLTIGIEDF